MIGAQTYEQVEVDFADGFFVIDQVIVWIFVFSVVYAEALWPPF